MSAKSHKKSVETQTGNCTAGQPSRLHHNAYVVADQEKTRHFYEDLIGMPLTQFWIEHTEIMGEMHVYSHAFYGLADGGALAFFCFDGETHRQRYQPKKQELFVHIALKVDKQTQDAIRSRLQAAGVDVWDADHGYTYSIYVEDPDGLQVEFSADPPNIADIAAFQLQTAHHSLGNWMKGDRTPNNDVRAHAH